MNTIIAATFVSIVLLLQGCSPLPVREWPALEGSVLDARTEAPIKGAFVVARWIGYGGHTQSQCFHVEVAETDAQGRYRIAPWRNARDSAYLVDQRQTIERVHKPGYRESPLTRERESYLRGVYYLAQDTESVQTRLEYLKLLHGATRCGAQNESEKNRLPLLKALHDEARLHGGDKKPAANEMSLMESIRYDIEILELGFNEAEKRHLMRP